MPKRPTAKTSLLMLVQVWVGVAAQSVAAVAEVQTVLASSHIMVAPAPPPQTAVSVSRLPVVIFAQDGDEPSQCRTTPLSPTTKMSLSPLPQTLLSTSVLPEVMGNQALPFQRRIVPWSPTAKTLLGEVPQ